MFKRKSISLCLVVWFGIDIPKLAPNWCHCNAWVTSQKADITCCTLEAACWLWLGCWSNNVVNSHPSPGTFNCRVLCSVWCCSAHTHHIDPAINNALRIVTDACVLQQQKTFPSSQASNLVASSQWSHTVSSTLCHGAWTPASLSAHLYTECKCTVSQIETPICTRCRTTHQFIWQQHMCGALDWMITDGMWNGWTTLQDSAL